MADGKKMYLNLITGEVVRRNLWLSAFIYFKADEKTFGYKVRRADIVRYKP